MSKKIKKEPKVNPALKGFNMEINDFGEITSTISIEKINSFLDETVDDKKLKDRPEIESE